MANKVLVRSFMSINPFSLQELINAFLLQLPEDAIVRGPIPMTATSRPDNVHDIEYAALVTYEVHE